MNGMQWVAWLGATVVGAAGGTAYLHKNFISVKEWAHIDKRLDGIERAINSVHEWQLQRGK